MAEVSRYAAAGLPLVLSCRGTEYEEAVTEAGMHLPGALVVDMRQVEPKRVAASLTTGLIDGERRFAAVAEELRTDPDGELAATLTTPLAFYLARERYRVPGSDPGELLAMSAEQIDTCLIVGYLDAVYSPDRAADGHTSSATAARRYLTWMARVSARGFLRPLG